MKDHHTRKPSQHRAGTTLVEVVMASMLVGIVLVGALKASGAVLRARRAAAAMAVGPMLAEDLLAEIMGMPYEDTENHDAGSRGIEDDESDDSRADFDDVDDYDDWEEEGIEDKQGTAVADYADWERTVRVNWADRISGSPVFLVDTNLKRIEVVVTSPDGEVTTLYGYRAQSGALEQPPVVDTQVVTWVQATLVLGDSKESEVSTAMLNHVEDPAATP